MIRPAGIADLQVRSGSGSGGAVRADLEVRAPIQNRLLHTLWRSALPQKGLVS